MKILIGFIALFFATTLSAQESSDWKLLESKNGVNIYSKLEHCIIPAEGTNDDYYLFKIENTNAFPTKVNWKIDGWYNGKCYSCETNDENPIHQFEIPSNSNIEGICGMYKTKSLKVYVKNNQFPSKAKFSKFTISTFSVKPAL